MNPVERKTTTTVLTVAAAVAQPISKLPIIREDVDIDDIGRIEGAATGQNVDHAEDAHCREYAQRDDEGENVIEAGDGDMEKLLPKVGAIDARRVEYVGGDILQSRRER